MLDVLFYEVFREEEVALRKYLPNLIRARFTWKTIQEASFQDPGCSLISIRTQSRVPKAWRQHIKGILSRSQGYEHLTGYVSRNGGDIRLGYLGDYCSLSVAEHAVMTMMALLKRLPRQRGQLATFDRDGLTGLECQGRRALVVGVGHIGAKIVKIARALNMRIKGVDLVQRVPSLEYVSLNSGLRWAEVVFCALPLTEKTDRILRYEKLKLINPGAIFINIARGEISPLEDLARLLNENVLGGLSLDVYANEDKLAIALRSGHPELSRDTKLILSLKDRDNVLLTPHNAFNTIEAVDRKAKQTIESIKFFLKYKRFPHPVPSTTGE